MIAPSRLEIARSHEIVAEIHDKRGQLDKALPHLREAVTLKEDILAETDPEMLSSWNVLASGCMRWSRPRRTCRPRAR